MPDGAEDLLLLIWIEINRSGLVGDVSPFVQRDQHVGLARIHHFDIGIFLADHLSQTERNVQIDIFFFVNPADGSRVPSAVSRINYDGIYTDFFLLRVSSNNDAEKQKENDRNR